MADTILTLLPLTFLIAAALITKKMAESMVAAALLAMVILYRGDFVDGTIDSLYNTLSNSSYQFVIFILVGFGGMIKLLQESGALSGFNDMAGKLASGPRKPLLLAMLMSIIMFVDEYLSVLAVTFAIKGTTDKNGIPREHLAFQANTVGCCLCVLVPFSSWVAFTVGLLSEYGLTFGDYISALPFMFYPVLIILMLLLLALGVIPKVGTLKESYERVASGGPALPDEGSEKSLVDIEMPDEEKSSSALNAIIPIVILVAGVLIFDNDLIHGILLAVLAQFILYIPQRLMSISEFFGYFFEGAKSMTSLAIVICFGFMLSSANQELGLFDLLIGTVGTAVPKWVLPAVAFVLVGFTTFATGGCWVMQIIVIPIFIPVAMAAGIPVKLVIAAIMSAVTLGYSCCFYADSVFMTSAGSGVSNMRIIKTAAPYAAGVAVLTLAGYLAAGLLMT
ncbi:MAG: Na+/H+ antiporter NhaC family protein [Firmicutes bacterium]|nr:Na+/H+ antiporter NhaC family protein [Bacillota bacterium]